MKAALHPRHAERLAALRAYDILDTPRESDFDEIVLLASEICEAPISVVNLIDADRQWFKAEVGLGVRETPLDTSLCAHAILDVDFMEIPDTLQDGRMSDNALCTGEPYLRYYAGALLQTADGLPLGTLCVLDFTPRTLTPFQRNALQVLARQVMTQLDLRLSLKRQALLQKEIDHRVKNSLQSVAAMVHLQTRNAEDPDLRAALEKVEVRIHTISLVHEELYGEGATEHIDLARYLSRLCGLLQRAAPANVAIAAEVEPIQIDPARAASLGMIVSEFAMNATKYAFPDGRAGTVRVALRGGSDGMADMTCTDDGVGLPDGAAPKAGLGTRLIHAAASQMGGRVAHRQDGAGYGLQVTFPV